LSHALLLPLSHLLLLPFHSDLSMLTRINPRAYGRETAHELARVFGLQVDSSTVTRWLEIMRLSRKRYNSRRVGGSGLVVLVVPVVLVVLGAVVVERECRGPV